MFMDHLIQKFRKDVKRLQGNFLKEKENLVQKIHNLNIKQSFQEKKEEIEKTAFENFKKFEPIYQKITEDLSKKARRAGLDLKILEKKLTPEKKTSKKSSPKTREVIKKKTVKKTLSPQKNTKKVAKKISTKKTTKKTSSVTKTTKKVTKKIAKKKPSIKKTR